MGQSFQPALRPYLPSDAPVLAEIFRVAIEELTEEDYDERQRAAWASAADDEEAFGALLAGGLTLLATVGGSPVGFTSLKGADHVEYLYVHPSVAGQGIAALLLGALEKLAGARGAAKLTADVSDTARGFFEKHGFEAQRRETVERAGEWLGRTAMTKTLGGKTEPRMSDLPGMKRS